MIALDIPAADFGAHMLTSVSEDSTSTALLALIAAAAVLANGAPAAILAPCAAAAMWADTAPAAPSAQPAMAAVGADPTPGNLLHQSRWQPCWQMPHLPHSLH